MPQAPLESVVAHWHKLFNDFNTSSDDFYAAVMLAIRQREIPGVKISRVTWKEGGILSPNREYLRVTGERYVFDMCAAPFGTCFFFSSWVTKKQERFVTLYVLAITVASYIVYRVLEPMLGGTLGRLIYPLTREWPRGLVGLGISLLELFVRSIWIILMPMSPFLVLCLVALAARGGFKGPEEAIRKVPMISWLYTRIFAPETYYRIDTLQMFQSAVHTAMVETIDGVVTQKGLRGLTEDERKPVFSQLLKR